MDILVNVRQMVLETLFTLFVTPLLCLIQPSNEAKHYVEYITKKKAQERKKYNNAFNDMKTFITSTKRTEMKKRIHKNISKE